MSRRKRPTKSNPTGEDKKGRPRYGRDDTKRPDSSPESPEKTETTDTPKENTHNDPEWYNVLPALLNSSSNLPYSDPFGELINYYSGKDIINNNSVPLGTRTFALTDYQDAQRNAAAGILTLVTKPSYGYTRDKRDPLNVCANAFYTQVRYVNSGRKNYDPADLMIYGLALADILSAIMWCERLYGYAFTYSQRNKYLGDELIKANGVDPVDMRHNLANFRYALNTFINKVATFCLPADINLFKRRVFMYAGLYTESSTGNIKDQLYQFAPAGFYKFALDSRGFGFLDFIPLSNIDDSEALMSIRDVIDYLNNMLDNIFGDEDFGLISGDILKSYGSNILGISNMPEDLLILPTYDPYVLSQFKNATITHAYLPNNESLDKKYLYNVKTDTAPGSGFKYEYGNLFQDSVGNLIYTDCIQYNDSVAESNQVFKDNCSTTVLMNKLISVEVPEPTPADNIEATRLTVGVGRQIYATADDPDTWPLGSECANVATPTLCTGDMIAIKAKITVRTRDEGEGKVPKFIQQTLLSNFIDFNFNLLFPMLDNMAQFHYFPPMYRLGDMESGTYSSGILPLTGFDNYTVVTHDILARMHECALFSLFYVPGVAKIVN